MYATQLRNVNGITFDKLQEKNVLPCWVLFGVVAAECVVTTAALDRACDVVGGGGVQSPSSGLAPSSGMAPFNPAVSSSSSSSSSSLEEDQKSSSPSEPAPGMVTTT